MSWWKGNFDSETSARTYRQHLKLEAVVAKRANDLQTLTGGKIDSGVQYRMVTTKAFNALTCLEFIASQFEIVELHLAIYRMNEASVHWLKKIITTVPSTIVVSNFFRENKKYERWARHLVMLNEQNPLCNVKFAVNHAKVLALRTKCGKCIVFEGSGNLSDNARIEQYLLEWNEITYNFHKQWMDEI